MEFLKKNATTIIVCLLAVAGLVWYMSSKGERAEQQIAYQNEVVPGGAPVGTPIGTIGVPGAAFGAIAGESSIDQIGVEILQILSQLDSIRLDASFFTTPGFTILRQSEQVIPTLVPRRGNPFAPIGSRGATTATNQSQEN